MRIPLDRNSDMPLYEQILHFLRQQIQSGALTAQTRLPASRDLASSLGVSRMTVVNAFAELEAEGLIYSQQGSGTFVAAQNSQSGGGNGRFPPSWPLWQQTIAQQAVVTLEDDFDHLVEDAPPGTINFMSGMGTTALFEVEEFRKTITAVLRRDGTTALGYGDNTRGGYPPLRQTIAHILSSQGIPAHPDNVLITSGSQQAIAIATQLLVRPGDVVLVENPTYDGAIDLFRSLGARPIGVSVDDEGMNIEQAEELLRTVHPSLIYTIPTFHNPTGVSLATHRRQQLVKLATHYNVPILEDDFVGDLRYEGHAQPALKALDHNGTVIYINTFSKALVPGLRIGFLVAEGPVYEQLLIHKRNHDRASSDLLQRALEAYITVGRYQAHVRRVCRAYRRRRNAMLESLGRHMPPGVKWKRPFGGLFIWLELPEGKTADSLFPLAIQTGVAFSPGSTMFVEKRPNPFLRLNFTVHEPDVVEEGIRRLGQAIKKLG